MIEKRPTRGQRLAAHRVDRKRGGGRRPQRVEGGLEGVDELAFADDVPESEAG